jgi:hypothetical protein
MTTLFHSTFPRAGCDELVGLNSERICLTLSALLPSDSTSKKRSKRERDLMGSESLRYTSPKLYYGRLRCR